jgi:hypothetical protein
VSATNLDRVRSAVTRLPFCFTNPRTLELEGLSAPIEVLTIAWV